MMGQEFGGSNYAAQKWALFVGKPFLAAPVFRFRKSGVKRFRQSAFVNRASVGDPHYPLENPV
jgi:hypothetical protein